tara:strand:- start:1297 stop:2346 length:1050 start_codon:yes stop_codon:yes gene_type:complete
MKYVIKFASRDEPLDDELEKFEVYGIDVGLIDWFSIVCTRCGGGGIMSFARTTKLHQDPDRVCDECGGSGVTKHFKVNHQHYGMPIRVRNEGFISGDEIETLYNYYIVTDIPFEYELDGFADWRDIKHYDTRKEARNWIENIPTITYSESVEKGWIVLHENECEDCGFNLNECKCEDDGEYKTNFEDGKIQSHYYIRNKKYVGEYKLWLSWVVRKLLRFYYKLKKLPYYTADDYASIDFLTKNSKIPTIVKDSFFEEVFFSFSVDRYNGSFDDRRIVKLKLDLIFEGYYAHIKPIKEKNQIIDLGYGLANSSSQTIRRIAKFKRSNASYYIIRAKLKTVILSDGTVISN